ncbi:MAG: hypothetical protein ACJ8G4_22315, partial [Burkholderiales bacterium]
AGNEIGFRINGAVPTGVGQVLTCTIWFAFAPEQGGQYHARYELDTVDKVCAAQVYRLSERSGKIAETSVKTRTFKEDIWGVGSQPCT